MITLEVEAADSMKNVKRKLQDKDRTGRRHCGGESKNSRQRRIPPDKTRKESL